MADVACRPIIKCGKSGCTGSCPLSLVEYWVYSWEEASHVPGLVEKTFPRPNCHSLSLLTCQKVRRKRETGIETPLPAMSRRSRNASPAMSRKSNVVSWSDSPREQSEANVLHREQSAPFGDASGSWEPGESASVLASPEVGSNAWTVEYWDLIVTDGIESLGFANSLKTRTFRFESVSESDYCQIGTTAIVMRDANAMYTLERAARALNERSLLIRGPAPSPRSTDDLKT